MFPHRTRKSDDIRFANWAFSRFCARCRELKRAYQRELKFRPDVVQQALDRATKSQTDSAAGVQAYVEQIQQLEQMRNELKQTAEAMQAEPELVTTSALPQSLQSWESEPRDFDEYDDNFGF